MPEVVRGSRPSFQEDARSPVSPSSNRGFFGPENQITREDSRNRPNGHDLKRRRSSYHNNPNEPEQDAYYDSRAATKREFKRRATTLGEYYAQHPTLLPQLPFTWRHGWRRWKLFFLIFVMFVDAWAVPVLLYYAMTFAGHVQGYIVFAVVATIWGGPTYLEFAVRSWRLIKKENFFRPLGTSNRWAFDITHWIMTLAIAAVTTFLVVGSAPHIVWLRILSLPAPALTLSIGGSIFALTMYSITGTKAPFRISSTPKGGEVYPGVYYLIEDIIAVNANAGRPYREALGARYTASPRFRRMIRNQSLFWSIPAVIISIALIIIVCIHQVPKNVAYGVGWSVPFVWAAIWAGITIPWVRRDMYMERITWEMDCGIQPDEEQKGSAEKDKQKQEGAIDSEDAVET